MSGSVRRPGRGLSWYLADVPPARLSVEADLGLDAPATPSPQRDQEGPAGPVAGLRAPLARLRAQATGKGVRVCLLDSGVDADHPRVGGVSASWTVHDAPAGAVVAPCDPHDLCGHGTAAAGLVRSLAPECELHSVQVLGPGATGSGERLLAGLRWAIREGFDVVNLSLSTTNPRWVAPLRELVDEAFFTGTVVVASAHNRRVESYPWRFSSVISVGSHVADDPDLLLYNPSPPVEFFAPGQNVEVAWVGGGTLRASGNSYATPFVAGLCALLRSAYPRLTPFQVKTLLYLSAANVRPVGGHLCPSR